MALSLTQNLFAASGIDYLIYLTCETPKRDVVVTEARFVEVAAAPLGASGEAAETRWGSLGFREVTQGRSCRPTLGFAGVTR